MTDDDLWIKLNWLLAVLPETPTRVYLDEVQPHGYLMFVVQYSDWGFTVSCSDVMNKSLTRLKEEISDSFYSLLLNNSKTDGGLS